MEDKSYLLVIKLPIVALDDVDARLQARCELADLGIRDKEMQYVKLQKIVAGQAPEGLDIGGLCL